MTKGRPDYEKWRAESTMGWIQDTLGDRDPLDTRRLWKIVLLFLLLFYYHYYYIIHSSPLLSFEFFTRRFDLGPRDFFRIFSV